MIPRTALASTPSAGARSTSGTPAILAKPAMSYSVASFLSTVADAGSTPTLTTAFLPMCAKKASGPVETRLCAKAWNCLFFL